ncbi:acetyl esterase/lipase [Cricetibacter osteomyelitidis]|uniref:Acetyl esterase/lipase n=1 Tax=Cricetibacter osteomyelitidis TaxID=1521931 RepID=A0A4R2T048_9PAST|nr:alpha/beta hydrolase [Cricetibacter osteomyelitidis]TCP96207.1 acetyl esterase/lipase [Cricetibacter osteomyelitidis]
MLQSIDIQINQISINNKTADIRMTKYIDSEIPPKASILYFHGGGLLYGTRNDLPLLHLESFTQAGFQVLCYDYPLAPKAQIGEVLQSVLDSIHSYNESLPFFLFGRSAGAYLTLLAATKFNADDNFKPNGIISFYGYGFLTDHWYEIPNSAYLKMPHITPEIIPTLYADTLITHAPMEGYYSAYIYARQSGKWKELFYQGRDKFFYTDFTLRLCDKINIPLFLTHATGDPDVPFTEFKALCDKYSVQRFIASSEMHDFDRDESAVQTTELLQHTIDFINNLI